MRSHFFGITIAQRPEVNESPKKISQTILTVGVFVFFVAVLFSFFKPIITGLLLGVVLFPLKKLIFDKKKCDKRWVSAVVTLLFSIFFLMPIVLVSFLLVDDLAELSRTSIEWFSDPNNFNELMSKARRVLPAGWTRQELIDRFSNFAQRASEFILTLVASFVGSIPKFVLDLILLILTIYYTLADGTAVIKRAPRYLPFNKMTSERILDVAHKIVRGSFIGSVLSAGAQAGIIATAFWLLDIPRAGLVGAVTFITSFVPILGVIPAGAFGVIYLFVQGYKLKALFMILAFVLAGTVDNLIKPWVLKGSANLHPLIGLLSALGGLALMGFIGIFIGPLVAAVCLESLSILEEEEIS